MRISESRMRESLEAKRILADILGLLKYRIYDFSIRDIDGSFSVVLSGLSGVGDMPPGAQEIDRVSEATRWKGVYEIKVRDDGTLYVDIK